MPTKFQGGHRKDRAKPPSSMPQPTTKVGRHLRISRLGCMV